jgi:hypothetical protein
MAQLIKPQNVKVVTKDGEILISLQLDININLNQTGVLSIEDNSIVKQVSTKPKNDEDDVAWAIPDFKPTEKIKFGK